MRCMACGAEMHVVQVVPDNTLMVPGYEHHTLQCSGCNDTERRLVFNREAAEQAAVAAEAEAAPVAPPAEPMSESANEPARTASPWQRAIAMFRGRHAGLR
jgi:hypothetical protein